MVRAGAIKLLVYPPHRQGYNWLPPKLFTENYKISMSTGRNFAVMFKEKYVLVAHVDLFEHSSSPPERNIKWPKTGGS